MFICSLIEQIMIEKISVIFKSYILIELINFKYVLMQLKITIVYQVTKGESVRNQYSSKSIVLI